MRRIIAAMQVSVDGFIEGRDGIADWVDTWEDTFDLLPQVDTFILGGGMFAGYEQYWSAVLAQPDGVLPFTGRIPTRNEVVYAQFAERTPHLVLSSTITQVRWRSARIITDMGEIRRIKDLPGKDIHAVGGAKVISSLFNEGLVDELRLTVHSLLAAKGKVLFEHVRERHALKLLKAEQLTGNRLSLVYAVNR
jgi:dihydrofolate reductase